MLKSMNTMKKWLCFALCACMLASVTACAEDAVATAEPAVEVTDAAATNSSDLTDDAVLATVNGEEIKWEAVKSIYESLVSNYGSYYDMTASDNITLFRAVALENQITEVLLMQEAKKNGLDQLTEEEKSEIIAQADSDWATALDNYISYYYTELTEESSEEEKAEAKLAAEAYYNEMGYSPEILREQYVKYEIFERVESLITQDVVVTDEEVETEYQAKVAEDKAQYENDLAAYIEYNNYVDQMAMYAMIYGSSSDMDYAWYKPAGFRAVKHILLPVDEALMNRYEDLQARLEEQMSEEESTEAGAEAEAVDTDAVNADATPEPTQEPVSHADVDNAKADILASLSSKIDEINQKVAEGVDFDELIATYAVKEDGSATDAGMTTEPYKTSGYEVARESNNYVPEFVEAAFSIDQIGEVSAPYLSDYGVHIVKYIGDVEAGPVQMTAEQREAKRASLLEEKKNEAYNAKLEEWMASAAIVYTGIIPSLKQIEEMQAAVDEEAVVESEPVEDPTQDPEATEAPEE